MDDYYYCYSYPQKEFLRSNKLEIIKTETNPNTNKKCWIFIRNEKLDDLLRKWQLRKKS